MTLLASWVSIDSRRPAAIYIMSDSRISCGNTAKFDFARKVFACKNSTDNFRYCGDLLFPSIVLGQLVDIIDLGVLLKPAATCEQKFEIVFSELVRLFKVYPKNAGITSDALEIIHACRDPNQNFFARKMRWEKHTGLWKASSVTFDDYSNKLFIAGSGAREFNEKFKGYLLSENKKTSRALFHCFWDTLKNIKDRYCGGAPQMVVRYCRQIGLNQSAYRG